MQFWHIDYIPDIKFVLLYYQSVIIINLVMNKLQLINLEETYSERELDPQKWQVQTYLAVRRS